MKCMQRNKSSFFYALYESKKEIEDEYGNATGEYELKYRNPKQFFANVSAAKGETSTRQFGESEDYDKIIVFDNEAPPIDEYSVLWVDTKHSLNEDGSLVKDDNGNAVTPHDYIVKKVAKSLNVVSIAISKVNVSG